MTQTEALRLALDEKVTLGEYLRGLRLCQTDMSLEKMAKKLAVQNLTCLM